MADRSYLDWPFFEDRHRKLAKELDDWCRQTKWPHHGDSVDAIDSPTDDIDAMSLDASITFKGSDTVDIDATCLKVSVSGEAD